jgi:hypothetical protein
MGSSTLLKNGKADEKMKIRTATNRQRNKTTILSFGIAAGVGAKPVAVPDWAGAEPSAFCIGRKLTVRHAHWQAG